MLVALTAAHWRFLLNIGSCDLGDPLVLSGITQILGSGGRPLTSLGHSFEPFCLMQGCGCAALPALPMPYHLSNICDEAMVLVFSSTMPFVRVTVPAGPAGIGCSCTEMGAIAQACQLNILS